MSVSLVTIVLFFGGSVFFIHFFSILWGFFKKQNKTVGDKNLNFPCPLLLTSMHFGAQWIFSYIACVLFPDVFGAKRVTDMSWKEFLGVSVPCGLVTSGDVGLSNLSMVSHSVLLHLNLATQVVIKCIFHGKCELRLLELF